MFPEETQRAQNGCHVFEELFKEENGLINAAPVMERGASSAEWEDMNGGSTVGAVWQDG